MYRLVVRYANTYYLLGKFHKKVNLNMPLDGIKSLPFDRQKA